MVRVEHELEIDRPPAEVFAFITDPAKVPEWQATALDARLESERMEKGARIVEVRKILGRELETTFQVEEYEPDRRYDLGVLSGPVSFRVSQNLERSNGGTKMRILVEGEPAGFFEYAEPEIERRVRRQLEDDFRMLKLVLEGSG